MQLAKQIWEDIRQGENIDLYITIAFAIVLTVLNLTGIASQSLVAPLSMAILGLLAVTALGNRYRIERVLQELVSLPIQYTQSIRVYPHWNDARVHSVLERAQKSIVIVESWVSEATTLCSFVKRARIHAENNLVVSFYVLDPEQPFGGQRYAEVMGCGSTTGNRRSLCPIRPPGQICAEVDNCRGGLNVLWKEAFRQRFLDSTSTLRRHLGKDDRIDLLISTYPFAPKIKMFIADNKEFVFSWFPVCEASSDNVCFHVSLSNHSRGAPASDAVLIVSHLKEELESIKSASQESEKTSNLWQMVGNK